MFTFLAILSAVQAASDGCIVYLKPGNETFDQVFARQTSILAQHDNRESPLAFTPLPNLNAYITTQCQQTMFLQAGSFEKTTQVSHAAKMQSFAGIGRTTSFHPDNIVIKDDGKFQTVEGIGTFWHLDRADGVFDSKLSKLPTSQGSGVVIYLLDTGVTTKHVEFEGIDIQVPPEANFVKSEGPEDLAGHGTMNAGVIAGKYVGLAKKVTIVSVKILNQIGDGDTTALLTALDYVVAEHKKRIVANGGKMVKSIVNLSASIPKDEQLNKAAAKISAEGILGVTTAGNQQGQDACDLSPASEGSFITVAATTQPQGGTNMSPAKFSNTGRCVDFWAPGSNIWSAYFKDPNTMTTSSGTSQSAPYVAAIAALILGQIDVAGKSGPEMVALITKRLEDTAEHDVINNCPADTINKFVSIEYIS